MESFYNVASAEKEYNREWGTPPSQHYHERWHGESFLQLVRSNFKAYSLYLLDEQEAVLSLQRQLMFLLEIVNCARENLFPEQKI